MKIKFKNLINIGICTFLLSVGSCTDDLDVEVNDDQNQTTDEFFSSDQAYLQALGKLYSGLAVSGQLGPGDSDISGIDAGFGQYLRGFWQLQELPTDEAVIAWGDPDLPVLNFGQWTSSNAFVRAFYDRANFQVSSVNEYLRQTTDGKLDSRGVSAALRTEIQGFRAEARFLRALSHFHLIDMFGNIAFFTENDPVVGFIPPQVSRKEAFDFVVSELLAIEDEMPAPRTNSYPRADQAAVWMLLSKLYLNAEVYTGVEMYTESLEYTNKILNVGFDLVDDYQKLFLADNNFNGSQSESIFSVAFDGINTQSFGGTTFLTHAPIGGNIRPRAFGIDGGWFGVRTTESFVELFGNSSGSFEIYEYDNDLRLLAEDAGTLKAFDADGDFEYLGTDENNINPAFDSNEVYNYNFLTGVITNNGAEVPAPTMAVSIASQPLWNDSRGKFYSNGQTLEIATLSNYSDGYAIQKWRNVGVDLAPGSDGTGTHVDADFHMFRLGEVFLNYAEAVVRGGTGGTPNDAVGYVNQLRERAYGDSSGNINAGDLTLDFLLDERGRELYWEGQRRTDLIRFEQFTGGTYLWPFKNGATNGSPLPPHISLFPIPSTELVANPNINQNSGY
ncbi:RagB/SusD family nutrient uptake outer membrane protein [Aquimarina sp. Aq107]|uniref:RagB/SusD family nutrient uptake outer membrane protein n=1 Tax=Aquimarina sp. Aq107 TaxID=1191912 RepID=UPI000D55A961|nr:RagB/SusD family nutrient uptake outer membrane protein [Aquimarina sp. Aq107]